jgi:hypothetical protein
VGHGRQGVAGVMPTCARCGTTGPTVEMRRLPKRYLVRERSGALSAPLALEEAQALAAASKGSLEALEQRYACKEKTACAARERRRASPGGERLGVVTRQGSSSES